MIRTLWSIALAILMLVLILLILVSYAHNSKELEETRSEQAIAHMQMLNEIRALTWCNSTDRAVPNLSTPEPKIVRPNDLVSSIHSNPHVYTGVEVAVPVRITKVESNKVYWYIGSELYAPVIEFNFPNAIVVEKGQVLWIVGTCLRREEDGLQRESPRIKFKVIVTNCRVVSTEER